MASLWMPPEKVAAVVSRAGDSDIFVSKWNEGAPSQVHPRSHRPDSSGLEYCFQLFGIRIYCPYNPLCVYQIAVETDLQAIYVEHLIAFTIFHQSLGRQVYLVESQGVREYR